ncbi:hypothetical protein BDZ88DRAFT_407244 [Geranomyces variabilis]|nr:hypothetical protein BDZ88DRAFT_407244 [Geranomyces variabilis]KAJ3139181.1 hypothetical protein HDU90_000545 [Geranomyces variabilis]
MTWAQASSCHPPSKIPDEFPASNNDQSALAPLPLKAAMDVATLPTCPTAHKPSCRSPPASPTLPAAAPKRRKILVSPSSPPPRQLSAAAIGPAPWSSPLNAHVGIDSNLAPAAASYPLPSGFGWGILISPSTSLSSSQVNGSFPFRQAPAHVPAVPPAETGQTERGVPPLLPSVGKLVTDLGSLSRFLETLYGSVTVRSISCEPLFCKVTCPNYLDSSSAGHAATGGVGASVAASGKPAPSSSFDDIAAQSLQAWLDEWKAVRISAKKPAEAKGKHPETGRPGARRPRGRRRKRGDSESAESDLEIPSDDDNEYIVNANGAESDSDAEGGRGRRYPQHVFLVGKPGYGKTSLVYSLAQFNGFDVLEMNAGQRRSGKDVATALGEAIDSQNIEQLSISGVAAGALRMRLQAASASDSGQTSAASSRGSSTSRLGTAGAAAAAVTPPEKKGKRGRKGGKTKEEKAAEAAAIKEARRKNFFAPASRQASNTSSRADPVEFSTAAAEKSAAQPDTPQAPVEDCVQAPSTDYMEPADQIDPLPPPPPADMPNFDFTVEPPPPPPLSEPPLPPQIQEQPPADVVEPTVEIAPSTAAAADESHPQTAAPILRRRLILVEDADFLCEADKGFWTTIVHLVRKSKCPIVFTCNEHPLTASNPAMPDSARAGLRTGTRTVQMRAGDAAQLACFLHLTLLDGGTWPREPAAVAEIARNARGDVRRCLNRLGVDLRPSKGVATARLAFPAARADGTATTMTGGDENGETDALECLREFVVADFANVVSAAAASPSPTPSSSSSSRDFDWTTTREVLRGLRDLDLRFERTAVADVIRSSTAARAAYEQIIGLELPPFTSPQQPHADTAHTPQPALRARPPALAAQNTIPALLALDIANTLSSLQPDRDNNTNNNNNEDDDDAIAPRLRALLAPTTVVAAHDLVRAPRACALDTLPQLAALCNADMARIAAHLAILNNNHHMQSKAPPPVVGGASGDDDDAPPVQAGTRRTTRRAAAAVAAAAVGPSPPPRRWLEDDVPITALLPLVQRFFHPASALPATAAAPPEIGAAAVKNRCNIVIDNPN